MLHKFKNNIMKVIILYLQSAYVVSKTIKTIKVVNINLVLYESISIIIKVSGRLNLRKK